MKVTCAYEPQVGRLDCKKNQFYNEMACDWHLKNLGEKVLLLGDCNEDVSQTD